MGFRPFFQPMGFSLPFSSHPGCAWVSGSEAVQTRCPHLHCRPAGSPTYKNGSSNKQPFAERQATKSLKQRPEHSIPRLNGTIYLLGFSVVLWFLLACSLSSICHVVSFSHTAPTSLRICFSHAYSLYILLPNRITMLGTPQTI